MTGGVEHDPDVVLGLEVGLLRAEGLASAIASARSLTSKSRCSIICCAPSAVGHTGRT